VDLSHAQTSPGMPPKNAGVRKANFTSTQWAMRLTSIPAKSQYESPPKTIENKTICASVGRANNNKASADETT
jgi:hypothetical protein